MPTRDQERAKLAFEAVRACPAGEQAEYKSLVLGLPALIHDNGLCQTVAFLQAKAKDKPQHKRALDDLCRMLLGSKENGGYDVLGAAVRGAELPRYQQLSGEALYCAEYLKRYAEAFLREADETGRAA